MRYEILDIRFIVNMHGSICVVINQTDDEHIPNISNAKYLQGAPH